MELAAIDNSSVVFLTSVHRPEGQLFLPYVAGALVTRYHFQRIPKDDEMSADILKFEMGEFNGVGINELSIYQDGLIVKSRANTRLIDEFIDDLMVWAQGELGLKETGIPPREKHYESAIVIKMSVGKKWAIPSSDKTNAFLTNAQIEYGLKEFLFSFGGYSSLVDTTAYPGRKPVPFTLARRVNVPFDADIYYSTAPLKTDDHLVLLENIEADLR
jgi:hypothetical protein